MEQKRGLTLIQQMIFSEVANDQFLSHNFYFTGGTALSAFYLHHRESEDLDFFSENQFDTNIIFEKVSQWAEKYHYTFQMRQIETVNIFTLKFTNGEILKVDFVYHPHMRLEKGITVDGIYIDSMKDIAANKVVAIIQRTEVKDFVDLYFLLQRYSLWDIRTGVEIKYHMEINPFILASEFAKVKGFGILPPMLKPLTLSNLQNFFNEQAQKLGKTVVE